MTDMPPAPIWSMSRYLRASRFPAESVSSIIACLRVGAA
jgi:hypothetical protein